MNLIQSLLIFLSFVAIKDVSSDSTFEIFLRELNILRQNYAEKYKVPNMHKLIESGDLLSILEHLNGIGGTDGGISWRYTYLNSYKTALSDYDIETDFHGKTPEEMKKGFKVNYNTIGRMELFNPLQRFIGCTPKLERNSSNLVCLIGPEGSFTMFGLIGKSTSVPGSECHKRYKNEGGLCVPNNEEEESYYGHPEDIIESVNQIREEYSKEFNVPNMHQLIWSEDLLKILSNMDRDNGFKGACVTWRYVHIDTSNKGSIKKELNNFIWKSAVDKRLFIRSNSDTTLGSPELLNPLQKFIACKRNSNALRFTCMLGTEGKFTMFDSSRYSKEIPGSNCQRRYRNESGVCVASNPEEESYFGRQLDFMNDINQIRRRYAKEYRVPNMHQLTWSNELAEVLEPLNIDDVRAQAKETWRYGAINTFDNSIYQIEKGVTRFFEMNRTAKELYIESSLGNDTMDRFEFLNPLQKTIACGQKKDWRNFIIYVFCLLGPEGNFTIFDTSFQSHLTAGSKCDEGYHNEDGLCSLPIPTQVPIIDYRKMAEEEKNKASTEEPEPELLVENHGNEISLSYLLVFLLAKLLFNI